MWKVLLDQPKIKGDNVATKTTYSKLLPDVAALELTYRCNHKCIFCSCPWEAEKDYQKDELTYKQWTQAIDELLKNGTSSFTLTGGEPLMRDDLKDIVDYVLSHGAKLNIISNGRKIDDSFLDFIAERKISMCISVPGINTFKKHTGVDNIEHVLSLFEKTRERGIQATANIAVTKKNLPELYENIALPLIHGADYVLLNRFLPGGRGLSNTEYLLSKEETNYMLDIAEEVLSKANKYGHVGTELPLCALNNPDKYKHIKVSNLCSAAKGFYIVDPSGYLKVCNHSPTRICRYDELETLKDNLYWNTFRHREYLPDMCKDCDKTDICDGGCREAAHVYYGKTNDNDPIFEK